MWCLRGTILQSFLRAPPLHYVEAITAPLKPPVAGSLNSLG